MTRARLTRVEYDESIELSHIENPLVAMQEGENDHSSLNECYPTLKDTPAGDYTLYLRLLREGRELSVEIYNETGDRVSHGLSDVDSLFSSMVNFTSELTMVKDFEPPQIDRQIARFADLILEFLEFQSKGHAVGFIESVYSTILKVATLEKLKHARSITSEPPILATA